MCCLFVMSSVFKGMVTRPWLLPIQLSHLCSLLEMWAGPQVELTEGEGTASTAPKAQQRPCMVMGPQ